MFSRNKTIYLDHAAATPMDARVFDAMKPYLTNEFSNPSALYASGVRARNAVEHSRKIIADALFTNPDSIIFTSSGTESNNLALLGVIKNVIPTAVEGSRCNTIHIITTLIEHDSVLAPIQELEKRGVDVTYVPVDEHGFVTVDQVEKALRPETILISIMYANNEVGTIQPIADIGRMILKYRKRNGNIYPLFHTDACQAVTSLPLDVEKLHVDLMTINGSKIYGPKGVGVLYKRRGVELEPIMFGGGQESSLRSGTENVAGIVGMAVAVESLKVHKVSKVKELRDYFWNEIKTKIGNVELSGPHINPMLPLRRGSIRPQPREGVSHDRLPNNLNISFLGCEAETLVLYLDAKEIACSAGSACSTDKQEPSHVLKALGLSQDRIESAVRFTLGKSTTKKDIDKVMKVLPEIVEKVRNMNNQ